MQCLDLYVLIFSERKWLYFIINYCFFIFLFIFITTIIIINYITLSIYLFLTNYSFILLNRISWVFCAWGKGKGERKWVRIRWWMDWGFAHKEELNVCVRWVRGEGGQEWNWVGMKEGGGRVDWGKNFYHKCTHFKHFRDFMYHFSSF